MIDLPKQLRIMAGMISMGERIAWGSDSAIMEQAADLIAKQQAEINGLKAEIERLRVELLSVKNKLAIMIDKHGEPDSWKCVVYDMEDSETKVRNKLIEMGWTPPKGLDLAEHDAEVETKLLETLIKHFDDVETWTAKELQAELMEISRLRNMPTNQLWEQSK